MIRAFTAPKNNTYGWVVLDDNGKLPLGLSPKASIYIREIKGDYVKVISSDGRNWKLRRWQVEVPDSWLVNFSKMEWVNEGDERVHNFLRSEILRIETSAEYDERVVNYFRWIIERSGLKDET